MTTGFITPDQEPALQLEVVGERTSSNGGVHSGAEL
jgi:hypothetical protein